MPQCPWCGCYGQHEPMCIGAHTVAPPVTTTETRREAHQAIEPEMPELRRQVLAAIRQAGRLGLTDEELQAQLGMNPSTERPRRVELVEAGLVVAGGARPTKSGRRAVAWVAP